MKNDRDLGVSSKIPVSDEYLSRGRHIIFIYLFFIGAV